KLGRACSRNVDGAGIRSRGRNLGNAEWSHLPPTWVQNHRSAPIRNPNHFRWSSSRADRVAESAVDVRFVVFMNEELRRFCSFLGFLCATNFAIASSSVVRLEESTFLCH